MNNLDYREHYHRNLPHIQPRGATFLVNYRLANSLPEEVLKELRAKAEQLEKGLLQIEDPLERSLVRYKEQRRLFGYWDEAELQRIIKYVLLNPVKAGLVKHWQDWKWSYCKYNL